MLVVRIALIGAITVLGILAIVGSASNPPSQATVSEVRNNIPSCSGAAQCARMWSAAQAWVANNAGMKLQIATDSILETYNSTSYSRLAVKVVKEPVGADGYRFVITTFCMDNSCIGPDPWAAALDFTRTVNVAGGNK